MGETFQCLHCCTTQLIVDAVDMSHIVAVSRGTLACGGCVELLEDADAEDRAVSEVRSRVAYVASCAGISVWALRLLGMESEVV